MGYAETTPQTQSNDSAGIVPNCQDDLSDLIARLKEAVRLNDLSP